MRIANRKDRRDRRPPSPGQAAAVAQTFLSVRSGDFRVARFRRSQDTDTDKNVPRTRRLESLRYGSFGATNR